MDRITVYYTDSYDGKSSHRLLRKIASELYGITEDQLVLVSEFGKKPYFTTPTGVHFSISHSDNLWACAFAPREVGLDVQIINHRRDPLSLSKRFFHPDEALYVGDATDAITTFTEIWARKEAVVKLFGVGIAGYFDKFSTVSEPIVFEGKDVQVANFLISPEFASAIAYSGEFEIKTVKI
ncbi:MAG: 4'-phosphopantetheinyl transferase superfamily protein [Ruminococcaceae bacterium]|nr:4'-phosphopantetheinyl transferase superfamily protein [Oscillospiraceae bacterium]